MRPDVLETFPFFNWSLFSHSSSVRTDVVVRLQSIDGRVLSSPRFYYDMKETFRLARNQDPNLFKIADRLNVALRANDEKAVDQLRRLIEQRYMAEVGSAEYDVVLLIYDPVHRLQSGEIKKAVILASFIKVPGG